MENATMAIPEPQWAKISDLKAGDTVELHGFDCAKGTVTLEKDVWGNLFFPCATGRHFIDRQLDENGYLIGITIRPAAQVIPITQERTFMTNFNPDDATAVSSFFQSLADKVVLASTLPAKVAELSAVVDKLKSDVEAYREHNARMDEEITNLRRERATLQDENASLRSQLTSEQSDHSMAQTRWSQACSERDRWHNDYIALSLDILNAGNDHEEVKRERDDAQMKIMELEDQLRIANENCHWARSERDDALSKLNTVRSALAA
jgi:FtsZ-binding cell division protein ZapB